MSIVKTLVFPCTSRLFFKNVICLKEDFIDKECIHINFYGDSMLCSIINKLISGFSLVFTRDMDWFLEI